MLRQEFFKQNKGKIPTKTIKLPEQKTIDCILINDGKISITFNGEIYNFLEVRKELEQKGYKLISHSDTEVILFSYLEWGEKCIEKFNGMFALAIYDENSQKI